MLGTYPLFEQFVRGEFSPYSLFKSNAPTDLNAPLNIFSLMGRPYPSSVMHVDMSRCIMIVKQWEKFFEVFCSVSKSSNYLWTDVFFDFIYRLNYDQRLNLADPCFVLDSFNNALCDWFQLVKNHFSIDHCKYAFTVHLSAMYLLRDLLSKISSDFLATSTYATRKNSNLTLVCFEWVPVALKFKPLISQDNAPNSPSAQICFYHICNNLLGLEAPIGVFCRGSKSSCKYVHPELSDLPALKETIVSFMSQNKKIPDKLRDDVCEQIDIISGAAP